MSLPNNIRDREYAKFDMDEDGNTLVRTSAKGEFTFSGLKTGGSVTEVTLNDSTWTALPAISLAARNAIAIQNVSANEMKINYDSGVAGYVGIVITAGGERQYDITDGITLYGKSESGTTPTINIEELA